MKFGYVHVAGRSLANLNLNWMSHQN